MRSVYPLTQEYAVMVNGRLCAGGQRVVVDVGRRALFALEAVCAYVYTIIPFQNAVKRDRDWRSDKSVVTRARHAETRRRKKVVGRAIGVVNNVREWEVGLARVWKAAS